MDNQSVEINKVKSWALLSMWFGLFGFFIIFMPFSIYFGIKAYYYAHKSNLKIPVQAWIGLFFTLLFIIAYLIFFSNSMS